MDRAVLEISEKKLLDNYRNLASFLPANQHMIAVIKGDAYGIGSYKEASLLKQAGVNFFAVACIKEAVDLLDKGLDADILVLGHTIMDERKDLFNPHIIQTVGGLDYGNDIAEFAKENNQQVRVHFKIDSGMHRLGIRNDTDIDEIKKLYYNPYLKVEGALSHLSVADSLLAEDREYVFTQKERFDRWLKKAGSKGMVFPVTHLQASAAIVNYPQFLKDYTHCRPGILFIGFDSGFMEHPYKREEVFTLKSHIEKIDDLKEGEYIGYGRTYMAKKDMKIATIPIGYGDGLMRIYQEKGVVLINGVRCPFTGRISMDQCCVDVSNAGASLYDEVILLGRQKDEYIPIKEMADKCLSIPNEILTKINSRVSRNWTKDY